MTVLFLEPVFQERIWGGTALQTWFPDNHLGDNIGECWAISAHKHGLSKIKNGTYQGQTLREVYQKHPELFGNPAEGEFPLLVKILDANADLSVQVHPDDTYAQSVEHELGKTECWYVLDAAPGAKIIYGHQARNKTEFIQHIEAGEWAELLIEQPVKKGDFFYVPSGTIHALCAGTLILEVQQSSDTTYRLYDYDRKDDQGNLRELHLDKAIDVTTIPHQASTPTPKVAVDGTTEITTYVSNTFFTVKKATITDSYTYYREAPYVLATVASGIGTIDGTPVTKGASIVITTDTENVMFTGNIEVIFAYV